MDFDRIIVASGWQLVFALFVPLILVAWQYGLREVIFYCLATTAVEVLFAAMIWHPPVSQAVPVIGMTMGRLFLYLVVGFVITRMVSAQREQRQKLADANERLVAYAATAEQLAVSHERNRLARELHDTLAHTLSSLSVQLEAVDSVWSVAPEQAHDLLAKATGQRSLRPDRDAPGLAGTARLAVGRSRAGAGRAQPGRGHGCPQWTGCADRPLRRDRRPVAGGRAGDLSHGPGGAGQCGQTCRRAFGHCQAEPRQKEPCVLQIDDDGQGFDVIWPIEQ